MGIEQKKILALPKNGKRIVYHDFILGYEVMIIKVACRCGDYDECPELFSRAVVEGYLCDSVTYPADGESQEALLARLLGLINMDLPKLVNGILTEDMGRGESHVIH